MTRVRNTAAKKDSALLERRAAWVMEHWEDRPSLGYTDMLKDVRAHFACGKTAAEQAIARANEIRRQQFADPYVIDRMAAKVLEIAEDAKNKGKHRDAIYGISEAMKMRGLHAPEKIEVDDKRPEVDVDEAELEAMSDEQLAAIARLNIKRRT